jgi:hypothetical protein
MVVAEHWLWLVQEFEHWQAPPTQAPPVKPAAWHSAAQVASLQAEHETV